MTCTEADSWLVNVTFLPALRLCCGVDGKVSDAGAADTDSVGVIVSDGVPVVSTASVKFVADATT